MLVPMESLSLSEQNRNRGGVDGWSADGKWGEGIVGEEGGETGEDVQKAKNRNQDTTDCLEKK